MINPQQSAVPAATELSDPALEATAAEFATTAFAPTDGHATLPNLVPTANDSGFAATFSKSGVVDRTGPFFQSLGVNGRSCSSCHIQGEGWTISPRGVQARFEKTEGTDPIFRTRRWLELASGRRFKRRSTPRGLQHVAEQGTDPRRYRHSRQRRVRAGGGR